MYGDESDHGCDCHDGVCPDGDGLVKYEHCNTDIGCRKYYLLCRKMLLKNIKNYFSILG